MRIVTGLNILIILAISSLYSCADPSSSGPCEYSEEKFKMHVVEVQPDTTQENMFIVWVDFDGNIEWANSPQKFSEVRNVATDLEFLDKNHIQPGMIYSGTFYKIVAGSGNCDEFIVDWDQKLR